MTSFRQHAEKVRQLRSRFTARLNVRKYDSPHASLSGLFQHPAADHHSLTAKNVAACGPFIALAMA